MADQQPLNRLGDFLRDERQWYQLPQLFAMVRLIEIRNELRAKNLHDTEEPALPVGADPAESRSGAARSTGRSTARTTT